MTNYNQTLKTNNSSLEEIITQLNNMPDAGAGTELPTLTNEGSASDLLSGKQLIDGEGNVVTGTIPTKTSSDLTANGATVTIPSGYYASQATKTIASGSAKTPATTVTKNPSISVNSSGLITASVSGTQNVTPTVSAGYVSSGTAGTITVSGSATKQLTTQAAKTITPSISSQTAVASGVYTTGAVTVAPIPSNYEDVATETTEYTSLNDELEEVINSLPSGSSTGINVETIDVKIHFNHADNQTSKMMDIFGTFVQDNTVRFSDSFLSNYEDDNEYYTYKCAESSVLILRIPTTQYTLTSTALYEPYPMSSQCADVIGVDIEGASPIDIYITI